MGTKKNHQKTAKNSFFIWKTQSGSRKELVSLINNVLEDISIYHLRLKRIFFLKFQKITSVNFVGRNPRLLEIGAKWRTHWALKLQIKKKIKGVRGLAQEAQPSDLYPYARKSDTWVQKKNHQKTAKNSFFIWKTQSGSRKKLVLLINSVLEDILILHLKLKKNFFFGKKSFKKIQVLTL